MTIASKDIPYVREERLHKELSNITYKRDRLRDQIRKEGRDEILLERLQALETNACYIYRELEVRTARRKAHQQYTQQKYGKKFRKNKDNRAKPRQNRV